MKANNTFLAELYAGKCKIAQVLPQKIYLTFRIGKSMVQTTLTRITKEGQIDIDATLQLNTDKLALDTQRSSFTLSSIGPNNQITVIGIALIPLPRQSGELSKKYKLTQCSDKNAEIEISLRIKPLDTVASPDTKNFSITMQSSGVSSSRSIMQMQQFDKKAIISPRLFNMTQKDNKNFPPKPKSIKDIPLSSQLRQSKSKLQNENECLKELLKIELRKGDQSSKIIESLISVLEEANQSDVPPRNDLDETLLLEGIDKEDPIEKVCQRNAQLQKEIANLNAIINKLRQENKNLADSLCKYNEKTNQSTRIHSREIVHSSKELGRYQEAYTNDSAKKMDKLVVELNQLENDLYQKYEEVQRYKRKMKIAAKLPSLETAYVQKFGSPLINIRSIFDHFLNENKEMMKILLRFLKQQADNQSEGLIIKIKQKVDRTFGSLIAKKMNREIVLYEKGELIKAIEDLWMKST